MSSRSNPTDVIKHIQDANLSLTAGYTRDNSDRTADYLQGCVAATSRYLTKVMDQFTKFESNLHKIDPGKRDLTRKNFGINILKTTLDCIDTHVTQLTTQVEDFKKALNVGDGFDEAAKQKRIKKRWTDSKKMQTAESQATLNPYNADGRRVNEVRSSLQNEIARWQKSVSAPSELGSMGWQP